MADPPAWLKPEPSVRTCGSCGSTRMSGPTVVVSGGHCIPKLVKKIPPILIGEKAPFLSLSHTRWTKRCHSRETRKVKHENKMRDFSFFSSIPEENFAGCSSRRWRRCQPRPRQQRRPQLIHRARFSLSTGRFNPDNAPDGAVPVLLPLPAPAEGFAKCGRSLRRGLRPKVGLE